MYMGNETKIALDEEVTRVLRAPITKVWDLLGAETLEHARDIRVVLSNKDKIESCLLQDALKYEGKSPEANNFFNLLVAQHGYDTVVQFLATQIRL